MRLDGVAMNLKLEVRLKILYLITTPRWEEKTVNLGR